GYTLVNYGKLQVRFGHSGNNIQLRLRIQEATLRTQNPFRIRLELEVNLDIGATSKYIAALDNRRKTALLIEELAHLASCHTHFNTTNLCEHRCDPFRVLLLCLR
ncbi:MAG: hypothetical protein ABR530_03935, partial [Pyrinomonadaceae bacterium]